MSDTLHELVFDYLGAAYPALWIHSVEQEDAIKEIVAVAMSSDEDTGGPNYPVLARWDLSRGLYQWRDGRWQQVSVFANTSALSAVYDLEGMPSLCMQSLLPGVATEHGLDLTDEVETLQALRRARPVWDSLDVMDQTSSILILQNLQLYMTDASRVQSFLNFMYEAENVWRTRVVVISTTPAPLPEAIKHVFTVLTHPLPGRDKLRDILDEIACEDGDQPESEEEVESVVDAARGMTRGQARNAFAKCLLHPPHMVQAWPIFKEKAKSVKGNGLGLELHSDRHTTFDDLVGLGHIKQLYLEFVNNYARVRNNPRLRPHGLVLAGLSGTGKSLLCAAAGNSASPARPTIKWRLALTGSKYVSEGAHKMDQVINLLKSLAPCNVQIDEGGKARKASASDQEGGSSTQAGEMDSLWLEAHQEMEEDVYPIVTMNQEIIDIAANQPEYLARFDAVFFLDYPGREQLDQLWVHHMALYGLVMGMDDAYASMLASEKAWDSTQDLQHLQAWNEAKMLIRNEAEVQYRDLRAQNCIPRDYQWVGRDVDNCTRQAASRGIALMDTRIVLTVKLSKGVVDRMREAATESGWLDADHFDVYDKDRQEHIMADADNTPRSGRKIARRKRATTST